MPLRPANRGRHLLSPLSLGSAWVLLVPSIQIQHTSFGRANGRAAGVLTLILTAAHACCFTQHALTNMLAPGIITKNILRSLGSQGDWLPPPKRFKWKKTVKNPVSRVNVSSMAIQLTLDTVSDFGHSPPPPHCSDF